MTAAEPDELSHTQTYNDGSGPKVALIVGGAGTGKTTHLMGLMDWWVENQKLSPFEIGFVSFTRAARIEAAERAAKLHGLEDPEALHKKGWFKTLHGCCYELLRMKSQNMLTDSKGDRQWVAEALGTDVSGLASGGEDGANQDLAELLASGGKKRPADAALALWDAARNRVTTLKEVWERARRIDERTPDYEECLALVEKYEQAKRLDNKSDFTDLLARYAGWRFTPGAEPAKCMVEGWEPRLRIWFLDEAQDNSRLTDDAARRLTQHAEWVYLVGDPFQAIYQFSGADPANFQSWPVTPGHRRVLPQTFRCPAPVQQYGEQILQGCTDYWDREIQPADHPGSVEMISYNQPWPSMIDPSLGETWLLLARTNYLAARLAKRIEPTGYPWVPVRGFGSPWAAPARTQAFRGLIALQGDGVVTVPEWKEIVKLLPAKHQGVELLRRGTKKEWGDYGGNPDDLADLGLLPGWGATPALVELIKTGRWVDLCEHATQFVAAWNKWGWRSVLEPRIRVGTVHATKGMEADSVVLLTTVTHQVRNSSQDEEGLNEELRVWYVGATRARKRLIVVEEPGAMYRMELPRYAPRKEAGVEAPRESAVPVA